MRRHRGGPDASPPGDSGRAIEGNNAIVEPEPGFGKPALIATARRDGLDQSHRVVAEVTHGAAGKWRQALDGRHGTEICGTPQFLAVELTEVSMTGAD